MKKFAVFSGFLGSGKTTSMIALTQALDARGIKAAMISNDLGHGVALADHRLALFSGCRAEEITGECICYVNEQLAETLRRFYDEGCTLVVSDIPGFGVGALEHVYHGLTEKFPGEFSLAPFTVLVEPRTVELLQNAQGGDLDYLYRTQLIEADLIVLNKADLLTADGREAALQWLQAEFPDARVLAASARTGEGFLALADALLQGQASLRRPEIGYGGEAFRSAMGRMSEYYLQYHAAVCCADFDGSAYLRDLAARVQTGIAGAGFEIPHLKLLAWEPEGDYGKVDLLGCGREVELTQAFSRPCTELAVLLNASAACPLGRLEEILLGALETVSDQYRLELMVFKKEGLGMGT